MRDKIEIKDSLDFSIAITKLVESLTLRSREEEEEEEEEDWKRDPTKKYRMGEELNSSLVSTCTCMKARPKRRRKEV